MKKCKGCISNAIIRNSNYCTLCYKFTNKRCEYYRWKSWKKLLLLTLLLILFTLLVGCDCRTKEAYADIFPVIDKCDNESKYIAPEKITVNTPEAL